MRNRARLPNGTGIGISVCTLDGDHCLGSAQSNPKLANVLSIGVLKTLPCYPARSTANRLKNVIVLRREIRGIPDRLEVKDSKAKDS